MPDEENKAPQNQSSESPSVPPASPQPEKSESAPTTPATVEPTIAAQPVSNPGFGLAVVGLVLAFLPLQLIGLILSIVAKTKARSGTSANTLSIVGIVLNALFGVISAVAFSVLALIALSGVQNAATADAFVTAVQEKDFDTALSFTDDPNDAGTKTFLQNAASKIGTSHSQIDSAYNARQDMQGFVYELDGGSVKYAKVTIINKDSQRYVYDFTFGNSKFNPAPREQDAFTASDASDDVENGSSVESSEEAEKTPELACITSADIASLPASAQYYGTNASVFADSTYFFNENQVTYQYPEVSATNLSALVSYIKSLEGKSFTIEIEGLVSADRTASASLNLSLQRANKLKQELITRGVSSSKITVLTANTVNYQSTLTGEDFQKRGEIYLVKGC